MKILFWILAILSLPVALFLCVVCLFSQGLDLAGTFFGEIVNILGILAPVACIAAMVLGIIKLRKGSAKKALLFAVFGLVYCVAIFAGIYIDDAAHSAQVSKSIDELNKQIYGANWNAPPAIEGIPELYQEVLNKYYVAVRDTWPADKLMDLGAVTMPAYYGDASLEQIGFSLMDLNGDNINELVIGTTAADEGNGTVIFCIYSNPENPNFYIFPDEGETYYLHPGETDSTYTVEIAEDNGAWVIEPATAEDLFDFYFKEDATMDSANRMVLELIPFAEYK